MKPQSAKAKGRRWQYEVRDAFIKLAGKLLRDGDIRSNPMGAHGMDLLLSPAAREIFPYSIECKNVEKLSIWNAIEQAVTHDMRAIPLVAMKRNNYPGYVAIPMSHFMELLNAKIKSKNCSCSCHVYPGPASFTNDKEEY